MSLCFFAIIGNVSVSVLLTILLEDVLPITAERVERESEQMVGVEEALHAGDRLAHCDTGNASAHLS